MGKIKLPLRTTRSIARVKKLRQTDSLLAVQPLDAYRYLLNLLAKTDDDLECPIDFTYLIHCDLSAKSEASTGPDGESSSPLSTGKAKALVGQMEQLAEQFSGCIPSRSVLRREVVKTTEQDCWFYRDFVLIVAFGDSLSAALDFWKEAQEVVFPSGFKQTLGRHAYAALQLLLACPDDGIATDNWLLPSPAPASVPSAPHTVAFQH